MIGHLEEARPGMDFHMAHMKTAYINSIQAEHGQERRETTRRLAAMMLKDFVQMQTMHQFTPGAHAPVIEITGNNQRCIFRHHLGNAVTQYGYLLATPACKQTQVYTDAVQGLRPAFYGDFAMQQAALLAAMRGDIGVFIFDDGVFGQQGVA